MSAIRMVPRDLFAHQKVVVEAAAPPPVSIENQVVGPNDLKIHIHPKHTIPPHARPAEKHVAPVSPSQISVVSTADYDGSTQCDSASNPDVDDIDRLGMRLSTAAQSYRKYAHCVEDIYVMMRFAELVKLPDIQQGYAKLVLRTMRMLHLCQYPPDDIWTIMAHTSSYFETTFEACGCRMDKAEANNIIVPLVFVAHSYVEDETCPLRVWHKHLLRNYCSLKTLNAAVLRLLELRGYILRLDPKDVEERLAYLTPLPCSVN
jgi:hypothetical protein